MSDPIYAELLRIAAYMGVAWSAAWFLFRQNRSIEYLVYHKFEEVKLVLLEKLEYHERHDDARFDNLKKDIYTIRIANAARTGKSRPDECRTEALPDVV